MKGAKHTPGPWTPTNSWSRPEPEDPEMMNYSSQVMARAPFTENEHSDIPGELVEEQSVATAHGRTPEEVKANAEFIAQACNSHKDLLAALGKVAYEPIGGAEATDREVLNGVVEIARAAIAKVEGKKA